MEDKHPLFSIATPCWNSVSTIERTIKSILSQGFKDYEYIIIDGESTDGTLDIIKKYEPLFEGRMFWKSERDNGLYDAFNKGVERSSGVYCWNVNADDYLEPGALQKLADFIGEHNWWRLPIIAGEMNFVTQDGSKVLSVCKSNPKNLKQCFKTDHMGTPHPATLVPKEIYERIGAFDTFYKIIGDLDWFHRAYVSGEKIVFINAIITNMSDGGVSNAFDYKKSRRDRMHYLKKFFPNPFIRCFRLARWTISFYKTKLNHN